GEHPSPTGRRPDQDRPGARRSRRQRGGRMSETKPAWDKAIPGVHPGVAAPVTDEEIEAVKRQARELADGPGRRYLNEESRFLADSQTAAKHHQVNLELAIAERMDRRIIGAHRLALAAQRTDLR